MKSESKVVKVVRDHKKTKKLLQHSKGTYDHIGTILCCKNCRGSMVDATSSLI